MRSPIGVVWTFWTICLVCWSGCGGGDLDTRALDHTSPADGYKADARCARAADCPGVDTECGTRRCNDSACGFDFAPRGTLASDQIPGDCKVAVCDGSGAVVTEVDDLDVPAAASACTVGSCDSGVASTAPAAAGTACATGVCDGAGGCVECLQPADCPYEADRCEQNRCVGQVVLVDFASAMQVCPLNREQAGLFCGAACGQICTAVEASLYCGSGCEQQCSGDRCLLHCAAGCGQFCEGNCWLRCPSGTCGQVCVGGFCRTDAPAIACSGDCVVECPSCQVICPGGLPATGCGNNLYACGPCATPTPWPPSAGPLQGPVVTQGGSVVGPQQVPDVHDVSCGGGCNQYCVTDGVCKLSCGGGCGQYCAAGECQFSCGGGCAQYCAAEVCK